MFGNEKLKTGTASGQGETELNDGGPRNSRQASQAGGRGTRGKHRKQRRPRNSVQAIASSRRGTRCRSIVDVVDRGTRCAGSTGHTGNMGLATVCVPACEQAHTRPQRTEPPLAPPRPILVVAASIRVHACDAMPSQPVCSGLAAIGGSTPIRGRCAGKAGLGISQGGMVTAAGG
jgi:hypothetical protein